MSEKRQYNFKLCIKQIIFLTRGSKTISFFESLILGERVVGVVLTVSELGDVENTEIEIS